MVWIWYSLIQYEYENIYKMNNKSPIQLCVLYFIFGSRDSRIEGVWTLNKCEILFWYFENYLKQTEMK